MNPFGGYFIDLDICHLQSIQIRQGRCIDEPFIHMHVVQLRKIGHKKHFKQVEIRRTNMLQIDIRIF